MHVVVVWETAVFLTEKSSKNKSFRIKAFFRISAWNRVNLQQSNAAGTVNRIKFVKQVLDADVHKLIHVGGGRATRVFPQLCNDEQQREGHTVESICNKLDYTAAEDVRYYVTVIMWFQS